MCGLEPGPLCQESRPHWIDDGTMCRAPSPSPILLGTPESSQAATVLMRSEEVRAAANSATATVGQLTYDAFVRKYIYEPAAEAISKQGEDFVRRGLMNRGQAAEWVVAQRNSLLTAVRDQNNTPLGRAIAEYLKPRDQLPTVPDLEAKYSKPGSTTDEVYEAIIKSGRRTRGSVNKLGLVLRWGGPALIAVDISLSAYLIAEAPADQQGRVAAREVGGLAGAAGGGWLGAKLGCKAGALVGVWFEGVGAIPGCLVGGVLGGFGGGYVGSEAGSGFGEQLFDFSDTVIEWLDQEAE